MKWAVSGFLSIAAVLLLGQHCVAQQPFIYKGKLVDSASSSIVPGGKVFLLNKKDTVSVTPVATGLFTVNYIAGAADKILISSNGYAIHTILLDAAAQTDTVQVIRLLPKAKELTNVTVVAQSALIKQDIDRLIYNVQQDGDSKSTNLLDMMRKVPFLSVTGDDQLLMKGNRDFKLLMDGKSSGLFSSANLSQVLKSVPASTVLRIEVITIPPARYESEGYSGVINIITTKRINDGYNGSANMANGRFISGASASLNWRKQKFGLSFFGGGSLERTPYNSLQAETVTPSFHIDQQGNTKVNSRQAYANAMLSYEFDTLNLLTLNLGLNSGYAKTRTNLETFITIAPSQTQYYLSALDRKNNDNAFDVNINYQKGFKKDKNRIITASYKYMNNDSRAGFTNSVTKAQNFDSPDYLQENNTMLSEHNVQFDYVHPLKKVTIESGLKYISRSFSSDFSAAFFDGLSGNFKQDSANTGNLDFRLQVVSGYHSYVVRLKQVAFRAGVRYEATFTDAAFPSVNYNVKQEYSNLVPSVSLQYKLKKIGSVNVGFTQRVQRPGIALLNPLLVRTDPKFYRRGNPDLRPVLANNFTAGYSRFKKASLALSVNYSFSRNTIQSLAANGPADSVIIISYQNVGRYDRLGFNINMTIPVKKNISITTNGSVYYVDIRGSLEGEKLRNDGIEGFIYGYLNYQAKKDWRISLNGGFYGPTLNLQSRSNTYFYTSCSVSKQLLKKKATLTASIVNPFTSYRTIRTTINTEELYQQMVQRNVFRSYNLSFYIQFGKLEKEVKKNRRNINNDDAVIETGKAQ